MIIYNSIWNSLSNCISCIAICTEHLLSNDKAVDVFLKAALFFIAATISKPPSPCCEVTDGLLAGPLDLPSFSLFSLIISAIERVRVGSASGGGGGGGGGAEKKNKPDWIIVIYQTIQINLQYQP